MEFIKGIVAEIEQKCAQQELMKPQLQEFRSQFMAMKQSLQTIMDTNSFMVMTINRCID